MKSPFAMVCFTAALVPLLFAQTDQGKSVEGFAVTKGLRATLWAGTDLIHSPVAMDTDARGRLWVAEDMQNSGAANAPHARIKILADTDHDGKADTATLFGAQFPSKPMGIAVFDNVLVVSMSPSIQVYTDKNRDDRFDPDTDTHQIIAQGFHGQNHDHSLHAVVPGPDGKWYFNHGNIGADLTMPDGRIFHAASYYSENPESIGKRSHDGRLHVGGFGMRMDPDGRNAEVIFNNTRNAHAMVVTSFGDVLHADNDDPAHARAAWAMETANFGYASLEDGSRSWEDSAKSWEKKVVTQEVIRDAYEGHNKTSLRRDEGHWRQNLPGVTPPGNVWGPGAPTGDVFIEGDELGRALRGRYLVCETVHRAVFSFRPELRDAQIEMLDLDKSFFAADRASKNPLVSGFLPTDIASGLDGSLFVADWNSRVNARGAGNAEGAIYRIHRADETKVSMPHIDFGEPEGLMAALASPVPGVRWVAFTKIRELPDATTHLFAFLKRHQDNPHYCARAVFLLAQLADPAATQRVKQDLSAEAMEARIVAFRALKSAGREPLLPIIEQLALDKSPAVRREALLALRAQPLETIEKILVPLIAGFDGQNRWYLEALGAVCDGRAAEVYTRLVRPAQDTPASWNTRQKMLAWRLRSPEALQDLAACMMAQPLSLEEFRRLCYAFSICRTAEERAQNMEIMERLQTHPAYRTEPYQETLREFIEKDILDPAPAALTQDYLFPKQFGERSQPGTVEEIAALSPHPENGKVKSAVCLMCHTLGDQGVSVGPDLTNWAQARDVSSVVRAIVDPSAELAHGFDKPVVVKQGKFRLEGFSRGYSWHAGAIRVKTVGGVTLKVPHRRPHADIENLPGHSWMPTAADMGLAGQDVRDIAAYLMQGVQAGESVPEITPTFSRGEGPGWVNLTEADFLNVNCYTDTWRWEDGRVSCTGRPVGVIRYRDPLTNFEFSCEWMHKEKGGNSGVFVWATPDSLRRLAGGQGRLPQGIEVQVLDLGYKEIYEAAYKRPGDWFTSHGDVFPVGPIKMRPFPPVSPDGTRSFPSKETTLGINQWNHYYIRAISGEVRLWVNGEEVSGGDGISPASGYLCLESEGAPIEFRNLRLRKLPPLHTALPAGGDIPVPVIENPNHCPAINLKGHALLGIWHYHNDYTREFLENGQCVLRKGDEMIWTKPAIAQTTTSITIDGGLTHVLEGDALNIEGKYQATRKK